MSQTNNSDKGIGFMSLLQLVFIVLKLCEVIKWSWWWVLSPTLLGLGITLLLLIGIVLYAIFKK